MLSYTSTTPRPQDQTGEPPLTTASTTRQRFAARRGPWLTALLFLILAGAGAPAWAASSGELKAAYLFNFTKYVEWPGEHDQESLVIGLFGEGDALAQQLRQGASGRTVRGKPVKVVQIDSLDQVRAQGVNLLSVGPQASGDAGNIMRQLRGARVLLVTENATQPREIMINLLRPDAQHMRFEINKANALVEGLRISKDILLLGGTELDVAQLFKETEQELGQSRRRSQELQRQLAQQAAQIESQNREIALKTSKLLEQDQAISARQQELETRTAELRSQEKLLAQYESERKKIQDDLSNLTRKLDDSQAKVVAAQQSMQSVREQAEIKQREVESRQREVSLLSEQIRTKFDTLQQQQDKLRMLNAQIGQQSTQLKEQGALIQSQKQLLIGVTAGLAIVGLLVVVTTVSYRQASRARTALARNNEALAETVEQLTATQAELTTTLHQLDSARQDAEQASIAKSAFLANMSHEIRTPMNAILGFAQLLQLDDNLSSSQQDQLGIINRSGQHLLNLINDILEMSKIEAGRAQLHEADFDLHELVQDITRLFHAQASRKNLSVALHIPPDMPRFVHADPAKLRQILINLIGNAVKFTERGSVQIHMDTALLGSGRARVSLQVQDSGPGIPPDELELVFEQFQQSRHNAGRAGGTGLGLAISRQYARLMGGDVTAISEPGKGSTFTLTIEVELGNARDPQAASQAPLLVDVPAGRPTPRVLVVDDQPDNRAVLRAMLNRAGFPVIEAENGEQAVAHCVNGDCELVLMDLAMPVMDGLEATQLIRRLPIPVPVVIVSANVLGGQQDEAVAAGAEGFLPKPIEEQGLLAMVGRVLGLSYKTSPGTGAVRMPSGRRLTPEALAGLPDGLREQLVSAASGGFMDRLAQLITVVNEQHPELARGLRELADEYRIEELLALLEKPRP